MSGLQPSIHQQIKMFRDRAAEATANAESAPDGYRRDSFLINASGWTALADSLDRELLRSKPATG